MKRGFSTIELLIAMTILIIVLTAVAVTSFGDQSFLIGSQTNAEAMIKAQGALEAQQAFARKDFSLVTATSSTDGFFTTKIKVTNAPGVAPHPFDYLTKTVSSVVSWIDERGVARNLTLNTLISNFNGASGGSTCNSSPEGNWTAPTSNAYSIKVLAGAAASGMSYPVSAMDAYLDKLYVSVAATTDWTDKTFFIFNLSSGVPAYISGSAVDTSGPTSGKGPNAVVVASSSAWTTGARTYAFLANGVSPIWNNPSCVLGPSCSQLAVIDVTNPATPSVTYFKFATSTFSIPVSTSPYVTGLIAGQATGKSIYYRNGYIFLGLTKTSSGPEFHIIDVHNPLAPKSIGSYSVGNTVNSIFVKGNYVYLATDDNTAGNNNVLTILNISDPTNPQRVWPNVISSSFGVGAGVTAVGDTLYFGSTYNNATPPELFLFDNANPSTVAPTLRAGFSLSGLLSVRSVLIRDYLALLLLSTNSLQIINSGSGVQYAPPITLPGPGSAIDCEGNNVYVGSSDANGGIMKVTGS